MPRLIWPLFYCQITAIKVLINAGADVNSQNLDDGDTPLHIASESSYIEAELAIIKSGPDVHVKNKHEETPLHKATRKGNPDVVEALLKKGADPNQADNNGQTPLDLATENGHTKLINLFRSK